MISIRIRRARPADAMAIAAVHVAGWRSAYAGLLPDRFLATLSVTRQAMQYEAAIASSAQVFVASAAGAELPPERGPRIVGFATAARTRGADGAGHRLGDAEIETLYVLDDWQDRGVGRRLMRAAAIALADAGCRSLFVWVLRDNPSRWFYQRLGGKPAAAKMIEVGGHGVPELAFTWDPIDRLLEASQQAW